MARKKNHETPDQKRLSIILDKPQLKALRHIGIDLEMTDEEIVALAINALVQNYRVCGPVDSKDDLIHPDVQKLIKAFALVSNESNSD